MGLEAVKEEVLNNARMQASAIIADARKEAARIAREVDKKIEEIKEKSEAETKKTIEAIKRQETASAELESKKILLETKKRLIDGVFEEARAYLENLDEKQRGAYLQKLIHKVTAEIEVGHIYCSKKDSKLIKEKAEHMEMLGGIIAENKESTVRIDYSYEGLLQTIKDTQMQHINKILFGSS